MSGNTINSNDIPSVGGSKEVTINIPNIACRLFSLRKVAFKSLIFIRNVIRMGNSKMRPSHADVDINCDKKILISQMFFTPKLIFMLASVCMVKYKILKLYIKPKAKRHSMSGNKRNTIFFSLDLRPPNMNA